MHILKFEQNKTGKYLDEQKTAMKNKDSDLIETGREVKEVYTEFYKYLVSTSIASTHPEQMSEDYVNKLF